jgi:peroxiredoxin Q/BCP
VVGISFDDPADNKAFRDAQGFPFPLLSDVDRSIGTAYRVLRNPEASTGGYPKRVAYLIDPDGIIAAADEVTDPAGFAAAALATLAAAQR